MSPVKCTVKPNLFNRILFGSLFLTTIIGVPWYAKVVGISAFEWGLFFFYAVATGLSITVGYHRLFAHRSFETNQFIIFLNLVFGAAALEESVLHWASLHRDHHRYVDTPQDPYNIKQGFWHAHIGWMMNWRNVPDYTNVKDLYANPLIKHQHKNYKYWALGAGVVMPLVIGALAGHLLGTFLLVVVARIVLIHHSTWSINSICHTFGKATYDIDASAKDHWLVAFITNGEGYHNFHHRFPNDYRNGVRWYQWDPSKWIIAGLSYIGVTKKLYKTPNFRIMQARTAAEHLRLERKLQSRKDPEGAVLVDRARAYYTELKDKLQAWENSEFEWAQLQKKLSEISQERLQTLQAQIKQHRETFYEARKDWVRCLRQPSLLPAF